MTPPESQEQTMSNGLERSNDLYVTIGEREYIIYEGKIIEDEDAEKIYTSYLELVS
jgi:hypothetical protein